MRWGCQRNNQRSPKTLLFVFRRFVCRPAAFLSVWGGQREREASLFNLKFLAARVRVYVRQLTDGRVFAAVCGQPVFEVGVVGADEDGGAFLVKIDFCAVYTEKDYRCKGIAGHLLNMVVEDMKAKGITPIYLVTDHTSFYERYGWEFLCMVQGDGEDHMTRMYIHR